MSATDVTDRSILHVDMDAFYASVEVMDDPALAGKAVIVGGSAESRGVVSAASYEARKFGVHSAMSTFRAKKLCPDGVFVSPRMSRYAEISHDIHAIFEDYTPVIEPISLDEAFLDVTGSVRLFGKPETIGRTIKRRISEEIGLVASVGVAPNKFLAKLASDLEKPDGFVIITQEDAERRLADLSVSRLWGVGKVSQKSLAQVGIHKIRDITGMPEAQLETIVGSYARRLKNLALGIDNRPVVADGTAKSIGAEITFAEDIADGDALRSQLDALIERATRRLRRAGLAAHTIHLKARYADFKTVTRAVTLSEPTALTPAIRDAARELLEHRLDRRGRPLRLLGVSLSNLVRSADSQEFLFEDRGVARNRRIDAVVDSLQDRFGGDVIHRGSPRRRGS